MPKTIETDRLRIVAADLALSRAEIADRARFAELLGARVPDNWPPESSADALEFFLVLLEDNPSWEGWLAWYVLERSDSGGEAASGPRGEATASGAGGAAWTLVGGAGFKGAPDAEGRVETGYSVLPQFQGRGIASEAVGALVRWALGPGGAREVLAQTTDDNLGSRGVLRRLGFVECGPGTEPGHTMYRVTAAPGAR